jgi:hypothetical protein
MTQVNSLDLLGETLKADQSFAVRLEQVLPLARRMAIWATNEPVPDASSGRARISRTPHPVSARVAVS